ncbi:DUF1758 domain-containing protein [Trichonephila clavipes]|nr:DUF1758 domain-containing protein [Trichonephila clavipes]
MSVLKGQACEKKRLMFVYRVWAHPIRVQMGLLRFTSRFPSQNSFHAFVYVINKIVVVRLTCSLVLLKGQTLSLDKDKPFPIRSELGWIIGGKANSSGQNSFHVNHIQLVSDHVINKFWELDSVPCAKPLTSLEEAYEDHFVKTHSRNENGRYTMRLPFHTSRTRLCNSKQNAIRRLISVERHLISNPGKYKLYRNFMKEYLDLKHMCVCGTGSGL